MLAKEFGFTAGKFVKVTMGLGKILTRSKKFRGGAAPLHPFPKTLHGWMEKLRNDLIFHFTSNIGGIVLTSPKKLV